MASLKRPRGLDKEEFGREKSRKLVHQVEGQSLVAKDPFSLLSDELLVRILSFLPVQNVTTCQRLSRRFDRLASDPQIWRSAYFKQFPVSRATLTAGTFAAAAARSAEGANNGRDKASGHGLTRDRSWKSRYKIRYNWSRGSCILRETRISGPAPEDSMIIQHCNDTIITADRTGGLRLWKAARQCHLMAACPMACIQEKLRTTSIPSAIAIDGESRPGGVRFCLGLQDGKMAVFEFREDHGALKQLMQMSISSMGRIEEIAYSSPFLVARDASQSLSVHVLQYPDSSGSLASEIPDAVSSWKSHTTWPPISMSLKSLPDRAVVSIAYSVPTYISGWGVGLQEIHVDHHGKLLRSRRASTTTQGFFPLQSYPLNARSLASFLRPRSRPLALSYRYPYLLATHGDNTLTVYVAQSTEAELRISQGRTLWGHTSTISHAQIKEEGKVVSVSNIGGDIRLWNLEEDYSQSTFTPSSSPRVSVTQVRATEEAEPSPVVEAAEESDAKSLDRRQRWVGFDEEKIIVLRGNVNGGNSLAIYDFT